MDTEEKDKKKSNSELRNVSSLFSKQNDASPLAKKGPVRRLPSFRRDNVNGWLPNGIVNGGALTTKDQPSTSGSAKQAQPIFSAFIPNLGMSRNSVAAAVKVEPLEKDTKVTAPSTNSTIERFNNLDVKKEPAKKIKPESAVTLMKENKFSVPGTLKSRDVAAISRSVASMSRNEILSKSEWHPEIDSCNQARWVPKFDNLRISESENLIKVICDRANEEQPSLNNFPMSLSAGPSVHSAAQSVADIFLHPPDGLTPNFILRLPTPLPLTRIESKEASESAPKKAKGRNTKKKKIEEAQATAVRSSCTLEDLPDGYKLGKIKILESGRVALVVGGMVFWLERAVSPTFNVEAAIANIDEASGTVSSLGHVENHLVAIPYVFPDSD